MPFSGCQVKKKKKKMVGNGASSLWNGLSPWSEAAGIYCPSEMPRKSHFKSHELLGTVTLLPDDGGLFCSILSLFSCCVVGEGRSSPALIHHILKELFSGQQ